MGDKMRNRILTKESVLEAAEIIIINEGMDHCSMRRISGALGVAVGTIYNYYESREELLVDLFTISWNKTIKKAKSVVEPSKPRDQQLMNFINVINLDVANRNGLGKEVYIFNSYVKEVETNTLNIRNELRAILELILNQKKGRKVADLILSHWIMTIYIDSLVNDRVMSSDEMVMLKQLIDVDFIV